jgi:hypothetical protein
VLTGSEITKQLGLRQLCVGVQQPGAVIVQFGLNLNAIHVFPFG